MQKRILLYNGFPFHYEMFGCILDFCNKNNIIPDIFNKCISEEWISVYSSKYTFNTIYKIIIKEANSYFCIFLLTDDDMTWADEELLTRNTVCIDHWYKCRRPSVLYHVPITKFNENIMNYVLPVFEYVDYSTKLQVLEKQKRPIITILGSSSLPVYSDFFHQISNIEEFDIYIINRYIHDVPKAWNIYTFADISAPKMFELLISSTYMYYYPSGNTKSLYQLLNYEMTSTLPMSFTCGCKCILPRQMNIHLKLKSVIEYEFIPGSILLDKTPSLVDTFKEREELIKIKDTTILSIFESIASNNSS